MAAGDEKRKRALVMSRVNRVRRRLDAEVLLGLLPAPLWVAATAFLLFRVAVRQHTALAAAVLALFALLALRTLFAKRRVSMDEAAVVADRLAGAEGLLLTRLELPVGAWELGLNERLREVPPPPVRLRRSAGLASLALLFWAVAALVPLPPRGPALRNAAGETRVEELAQKLEAVAREEPVSDAAKDALEDLQAELAAGSFDAADWEAADALDAALDAQAMEAQAELERAQDAARAFQDALAKGASGEAAARDREALESALLALSDGAASSGADALAQELARSGGEQQGREGQQGQDGQQGQQGQQGGQRSAQRGSEPSGSQADALRRALEQRQQALNKSMGSSGQQRSAQRQSGQGQPRSSQQGQSRGGRCQGKGQSDGQCQGQGEGQAEGQGQGRSGEGHASRAGQAGTGRGPGEGELVFGDEAEMDPERLAFSPLPEGQGGEPGDLWGLQRSDPRKSQGGPRSAASTVGAQGASAPAHREGELLPRNRALIRQYFDSKP